MTEKHKSERLIVVTSVMIMFCITKPKCEHKKCNLNTAHIFLTSIFFHQVIFAQNGLHLKKVRLTRLEQLSLAEFSSK